MSNYWLKEELLIRWGYWSGVIKRFPEEFNGSYYYQIINHHKEFVATYEMHLIIQEAFDNCETEIDLFDLLTRK